MYDKKMILEKLVFQIERELETAIHAAKTAHDDATGEESRAENEYDTRALEASYVARGQAQRVADLREALYDFKKIALRDFSQGQPIAATALVRVESSEKESLLLFMPKGGGIILNYQGERIQVVTPGTPLGKALLQMQEGDSVLVENGGQDREYEILAVY